MVIAAQRLAGQHFPDASVWSVPFIKPAAHSDIAALCRESACVVTLEEHSVIGGLGSLVAEIACDSAPARVLRIGVQDRFTEDCGTYTHLLKEHGLDDESVRARIAAFIRAGE
jgi:transketolase